MCDDLFGEQTFRTTKTTVNRHTGAALGDRIGFSRTQKSSFPAFERLRGEFSQFDAVNCLEPLLSATVVFIVFPV